MAIELNCQGVTFEQAIKIPTILNGQTIRYETTGYLMISDSILLNIRSLLDFPSKYDFAQMKTYLNGLSIRAGIIANFGKKQLQLYGVTAT